MSFDIGRQKPLAPHLSLKQLPTSCNPSILSDTLRECHGALLKEAQGQLAVIFLEYEERVLRLLRERGVEGHTGRDGSPVDGEKIQLLMPSVGEDGPAAASETGAALATAEPAASSISPRRAGGSPCSDGDVANGLFESRATAGSVESQVEKLDDGGVFEINIAAMELGGTTYRVEDFYKKDGWSQRIARDENFHHVTLGFIAVNALYLGLDADLNNEDVLMHAHLFWIVCENVFCVFFTAEIAVRFLAFERKLDCLKDGWFKFDACLVVLMIVEVWGMMLASLFGAELSGLPTGPLRLLRLLRLSRLSHLLSALPELVTMIKGMRAASRAVASCVIMTMFLVYVFSIVMLITCAGLASGTDDESRSIAGNFGRLILCMWTMLMHGTFLLETADVLTPLRDTDTFDGYLAILIFVIFMLLSAFTVLNMLIGVLCEVVTTIGRQDRDNADIALVKSGILNELAKFDVDGDGTITQDELEHVMNSEQAQAVLDDLEVDQASLDQLHAMLFPNKDDQVPILTIAENCLHFRGSQAATVKHLIDSMVFNRHFTEQLVRDSMKDMRRTVIRQSEAVVRTLLGPHRAERKLAEPSRLWSSLDAGEQLEPRPGAARWPKEHEI